MKPILQIDSLGIRYDNKRDILSGVSFSLESSEVLAIIGESGSGKTTLARAILNTLPYSAVVTSGTIKYKNLDILKQKEYSSLYGKEISAIFQDPSSYLNPVIKIKKQFVETVCSNHDVDKLEAYNIAISMLEKTNLIDTEKILNSYPFELSGGMLQRVMIAMIFALEPSLIIADEPTSALDVVSQKLVLDELLALRDRLGSSVIIITHSFSVASYIADSIAILYKGSVVEFGSKEEVLSNPKHPYTKELLSNIIYLQTEDRAC